MSELDVEALRARFPALSIEHDGRPMAFFDGPGGTQVTDTVIEAVSRYYREANANHGGTFLTSERSDEMLEEAHLALADLLNAADHESFLVMLPRLRSAFDRLHERQRSTLADRVASRYGLKDAEEVTRLSATVAVTALVARLDEQAGRILAEWGL